MQPRIAISTDTNGSLEISPNRAGRDFPGRELQHLDERDDHSHLDDEAWFGERPLRTIPYKAEDGIITCGKVLFRPDAWDAACFPHVLADPGADPGGGMNDHVA